MLPTHQSESPVPRNLHNAQPDELDGRLRGSRRGQHTLFGQVAINLVQRFV